jgi:lipopolysaccharide export system permease protein
VFWSILHRTILWELVRVFVLSLVGITGMLLMAGIVAEASQHGLTPTQILAAIPLLIPSTLPYTLPATTLFATCVVYGRLAHDNEILAIKAAGINILSVVSPSVILGIAMTALTVVLYYDLIPTTHHMMRSMVLQDIEEFLYGVIKREHSIGQPRLGYQMQVKSVQGRTLIDAVFVHNDLKTQAEDVIARAQEAEMRVDLAHGKILFHMKRCQVSSSQDGTNGYFEDRIWDVDLPPDFDKTARKFRAGDMTWNELFDYREELRQQKEKMDVEIALRTSVLQGSKVEGAASKQQDLIHRINESRAKQNEVRNLETEMLMRPALAVGCFCFVIVGCPIGIWFSKSDYLSAFITCFLPIVFLYYPLLLCGANLAKTGKIHPALAVWAANMCMAAVALPLYRKLLKN